MAAESAMDDFDWVSAQSGCRIDLMFQRLLEGARKDVDRRNAAGECRYFVGEHEFLGWEVRKLALEPLFFGDDEEH